MSDIQNLPQSEPAEAGTSSSSSSQPSTPHEGIPTKVKGRQRLLIGLQRISSSQSLSGLRRSKSVGGNPYKTRASLSCASLAATGPPHAGRSTTPIPSPLGYPTNLTNESQVSEFPFYDENQADVAIRRVGTSNLATTPSTIPLPADFKASKQEGQIKRQVSSKSGRKAPFRIWDVMPLELKVQVLSYLDPKELIQISRVSKSFYKYAFDGQLWTSFDASEFYQDIPAESLARIIVAAGPFIKNLNLRGCVQVEHYKRTEVIAKACKNLMNATLEGCRNFQKNTLHSLLRSNEKLVHLNLTGLPAVTNTSCKIIAESCPQLETFNVSWCNKVEAKGIQTVVEACHKLRDLRAGEVRGFDDIGTAEAIFKQNKLERLVLSGCAELTDEALETMMHGVDPEIDVLTDLPIVPPRKLRHLDLSRCDSLTNRGVRSIGHMVPDLEGLQLSRCTSVTDAGLEPILASTPRLTHLELEDLEDVSNSLLSEHLAKAPCIPILEHLSLSYCENVGDVGVLPVMQKAVSLRSIDLDNTRISDLVLAEAAAMVLKRSARTTEERFRPKVSLQMVVYDCAHVTWVGVRSVLRSNTEVKPLANNPGKVTYPTEIIGLKSFYGFQMTVDEHQKRVLRGDAKSAGKLERKWADYMQANEEAGLMGSGYRRRRRRAREAQALHMDEEYGANGRRRARTMGSCAVM
ncbi:f-box-like domain-containing protein [Sarocladium implicatum]|nr:f-box-like domain-containing protein [Sarocladium implicatum]